jgi:hypothetical protein
MLAWRRLLPYRTGRSGLRAEAPFKTPGSPSLHSQLSTQKPEQFPLVGSGASQLALITANLSPSYRVQWAK